MPIIEDPEGCKDRRGRLSRMFPVFESAAVEINGRSVGLDLSGKRVYVAGLCKSGAEGCIVFATGVKGEFLGPDTVGLYLSGEVTSAAVKTVTMYDPYFNPEFFENQRVFWPDR